MKQQSPVPAHWVLLQGGGLTLQALAAVCHHERAETGKLVESWAERSAVGECQKELGEVKPCGMESDIWGKRHSGGGNGSGEQEALGDKRSGGITGSGDRVGATGGACSIRGPGEVDMDRVV